MLYDGNHLGCFGRVLSTCLSPLPDADRRVSCCHIAGPDPAGQSSLESVNDSPKRKTSLRLQEYRILLMIDLQRDFTAERECCLIVAVCLGIPIMSSLLAAAQLDEWTIHTFTNGKLVGMIAIEVQSLLAAGYILYLKGWRYHDLGLQITLKESLAGLGLIIVYYILYIFLWYVVGSFFISYTELAVPKFKAAYSLGIAISLSAINGFFEESVAAAYVISRLQHHGPVFAISLSALLRLLYHTYQGPMAVLSILPLGILFGFVYWRWRRLWPLIFAHFIMDVLAFYRMSLNPL